MPQVVAHGGPKPAGRACAQCHLPSGDGHPESASLAGLPAAYIIRQMGDFKRGQRNNPRAGVMIAMAQVFSDDEIKAAAEYFSKLKPTAGYNTVNETDTVPKSYVGAGGMRFASDGGETEPIGERIINVPKDATEAKLRDPHFGFTERHPERPAHRHRRRLHEARRRQADARRHDRARGLSGVPQALELFVLSMIFSENRFPLFGIML
jgi:cytochrome c553